MIESCGDIVKESRDDKDVELIVYMRWKSCVFNFGKLLFDNFGILGFIIVGIEMLIVV